MSRLTMHRIGLDRRPTGEGVEYPNSWLGHIAVWHALGERYAVPYSFSNAERVWALARHPSDPKAACKRVSECDRVLMAATFDRAWIARDNFVRFADAVAASHLPENLHFRSVADKLRGWASDESLLGVCFHATSVSEDVWYKSGADDQAGEYLTIEAVGADEVYEIVSTKYARPEESGAEPPPEPQSEPQSEPQPRSEPVSVSVPGRHSDRFVSDPAHYRHLCEPFESLDEAQAVLDEFYRAVRALRDEMEIPEVIVIAGCNVQMPANESNDHTASSAGGEPRARRVEVQVATHHVCGDLARAEELLARALACEQRSQHNTILSLLDGQTRVAETDTVLEAETEAVLCVEAARRAVEIAERANANAAARVAAADAALAKIGQGPLFSSAPTSPPAEA